MKSEDNSKQLAIMEQLELAGSWADWGQEQLVMEDAMVRLGGTEVGDTQDLGLDYGSADY